LKEKAGDELKKSLRPLTERGVVGNRGGKLKFLTAGRQVFLIGLRRGVLGEGKKPHKRGIGCAWGMKPLRGRGGRGGPMKGIVLGMFL